MISTTFINRLRISPRTICGHIAIRQIRSSAINTHLNRTRYRTSSLLICGVYYICLWFFCYGFYCDPPQYTLDAQICVTRSQSDCFYDNRSDFIVASNLALRTTAQIASHTQQTYRAFSTGRQFFLSTKKKIKLAQ